MSADSLDVALFRDLIRARTGMVLPESRTAELKRVIQRAVEESGVPEAGALYGLLLGGADSSERLDELVCALNVGETHFFRDARQMQALEQRILPNLISRRRRQRRLRIWSAGCSTGEEAYTLAILVNRLLPDLAEWDVLILATDINGQSLRRAAQGVYGAWSLRGMSPLELDPYLARRGKRFEVDPRTRAMVTFAQLNLAEDIYPSRATDTVAMDLILCRNVLLYFDQEGARAVVGRLRDALGDGGALLVSQVEAGLDVFEGLTQPVPGTAIYLKREPPPKPIGIRSDAPAAVRHADGRGAPILRPVSEPRRAPGRPPSPDPQDPATAHADALGLWRAGRAEAALRRLEVITERCPLASPLHYLYGLILLDGERTEEALAAFRRCTYADPECALGHLAQAGLLARLGLSGRARTALQTAARLVADLEPDALFSDGDGLTVGDVLELIAAQRDLLLIPGSTAVSHG